MGENTAIEWAKHTFSPWWGCTKVAAGCTHCYAEALSKRTGKAPWGDAGTRVKTSETNWNLPLKWNKLAEAEGVRHRVFCASMADVFEDWQGPILDHHGNRMGVRESGLEMALPQGGGKLGWTPTNATLERPGTMDDLREDLFALIDATPHLDWLLLTKRPENIRRMWPFEDGGLRAPFPGAPGGLGAPIPCVVQKRRNNVWLLTSVAEQQDADRNIPELLKCRALSPVLGLSCEPLVGPVALSTAGIDLVIVGGESGAKARPMHPDWARSIRDQCVAAGVRFFFKQWGDWQDGSCGDAPRKVVFNTGVVLDADEQLIDALPATARVMGSDSAYHAAHPTIMARVGKKNAGRMLDGREWNEMPERVSA